MERGRNVRLQNRGAGLTKKETYVRSTPESDGDFCCSFCADGNYYFPGIYASWIPPCTSLFCVRYFQSEGLRIYHGKW